MATNILDREEFSRFFKEELNASMSRVAEPILEKALEDMERTMREQMAQKLISLIENDFVVERMGHDIRITVRQAKR